MADIIFLKEQVILKKNNSSEGHLMSIFSADFPLFRSHDLPKIHLGLPLFYQFMCKDNTSAMQCIHKNQEHWPDHQDHQNCNVHAHTLRAIINVIHRWRHAYLQKWLYFLYQISLFQNKYLLNIECPVNISIYMLFTFLHILLVF